MNTCSTLKKLSTAAILTILSATSFQSVAGTKSNYSVSNSATHIRGAFGTARNSADIRQTLHIGDRGTVVTVWSRTAAGVVKSCTTSNATVMKVLRHATSNSYIYVNIKAGKCTRANVYRGSLFAPKVL